MGNQVNLVLGGAGLIGRRLVHLLRSRGEEVLVYDLKNGFDLRLRIPEAPSGAYCWFLAWDVGGAQYILDQSMQEQILQNNLLLCQSVFPWLKQNGIPFTFTSTQMIFYPNAYGLTKAVGEFWTKCLDTGLVARLWNVFDAEEPSLRSHVIPDLIQQSSTGTIKLLTSGEERRQFLLADDCAEALVHQRETGQTTADITSGTWVRVREVADAIGKITGVHVLLGDQRGYETLTLPNNPLKGWSPQYTLRSGLEIVVQRMKEKSWK